jgi:hypothetical protein
MREEFIDPYIQIYENDMVNCLEQLINKRLTDREKICIKDYYLSEEKTSLGIVAKKHNVTRERIRQICAKALRKLRYPSELTIELFEDYVNKPAHYYKECLYDLNEIKNRNKELISDSKEIIKTKPVFHLLQVHNKLIINESDSPKMKFKKFINNYPHLKNLKWKNVFEFNSIDALFPNLVFIPKSPNLLYQLNDIRKYQDDVYKWTRYLNLWS